MIDFIIFDEKIEKKIGKNTRIINSEYRTVPCWSLNILEDGECVKKISQKFMELQKLIVWKGILGNYKLKQDYTSMYKHKLLQKWGLEKDIV